jgi:tripartite-type tricarboxylate transporter receptor subunit TctC
MLRELAGAAPPSHGRRAFVRGAAATAAAPLAAALWSSPARSETYPARPVRVIVVSGPGGQGDTTARLFALSLGKNLGQSFYVENMAGGAGNIAMGIAARSPPDGYTILAATGSFVINPSLSPKISYDPERDFDPISLLCSSPHALVVNPNVPARNVAELVGLAKSEPGALSYASAGRGTPAHLAGELFKLAFGLDITHVPFAGGGPGILSTIAGHTPISVAAVPTAVTAVAAGQVRALAVMSAVRSSALPGVPSMAEASGHELTADIVTGFVARAGTPQAIIDRLHGEIVKIIAQPDVRERLAMLGFEPVGSTPAEYASWIKAERVKWAKVVHDARIAVE